MDQFTYVKRGYDPEEVDKYISTLEQVIKSYKDKDNAIKNSIISAQVAADNVLRNAQMHADAYKVQIGEQLSEIRGALDRQRMALQSFQEAYANMVRKSIQELEQSTSMTDLFVRLEEAEKAISDLEGLEAVSGPTAVPVSGHMPPPVDDRPEYLAQERPARSWDVQHDQPRDQRPALRDMEQSRDYGREVPPARRDMRDVTRDDIRDVMRHDRREPMQVPIHETLFDTDRDVRPPSREYDQPRDDRNYRNQNRNMDRDMVMAPVQEREAPRGYNRENAYAPLHETLADHDMRSPDREVHQEPIHRELPKDHTPYGYDAQYQNRDHGYQAKEWDTRDMGREYVQPERDPREMRRDTPSREVRRDVSREMRDPSRDVRRDHPSHLSHPNRDMMRTPPPMRPEPMRDQSGRPYMPEGNDYPDNDQNLLPPVASLM